MAMKLWWKVTWFRWCELSRPHKYGSSRRCGRHSGSESAGDWNIENSRHLFEGPEKPDPEPWLTKLPRREPEHRRATAHNASRSLSLSPLRWNTSQKRAKNPMKAVGLAWAIGFPFGILLLTKQEVDKDHLK
ncbi:hypothetical protein A6R68_20239 [Neotoma lepida]|uniref:Uncharacterized protein n=1 Tax=Neotoma lepida TaxID=56216 RepID=A0A1A6HTB9_NEOLE|nr:hypothetical protein A6R68_20239 [Neotoma lepida]